MIRTQRRDINECLNNMVMTSAFLTYYYSKTVRILRYRTIYAFASFVYDEIYIDYNSQGLRLLRVQFTEGTPIFAVVARRGKKRRYDRRRQISCLTSAKFGRGRVLFATKSRVRIVSRYFCTRRRCEGFEEYRRTSYVTSAHAVSALSLSRWRGAPRILDIGGCIIRAGMCLGPLLICNYARH